MLFTYLFISDWAGSSLLRVLLCSCRAQASHLSGFFCYGAQTRVHGLRQLRYAGSVVVAHWLSCFTSCEIFLDQGWNLCLLHWQEDSLPLSHEGSPSFIFGLGHFF